MPIPSLPPMPKRDIESKDSQDTVFVSLRQGSRHEATIHDDTLLESVDHSRLFWSRIRATCRDAFAEFFGTMILVLFGDGVVAQVVLSHEEKGNYQSISWGWG